jgi:Zn-dependent peptidase ImmA (M78 family)
MNDIIQRTSGWSVLQVLRYLIPNRGGVTFEEALRVAELQASQLLQVLDIDEFPVLNETISELPRIRIEYSDDLPSFGLSFWNGRCWIIELSTRQSRARQRFTLFHEYKHIIDHGSAARLYPGDARHKATVQAELVADYFAGCVLVPRRALKSAWGHGVQKVHDLARLFDVSEQAIAVRLDQTGLRQPLEGCHQSTSAPRWWIAPSRASSTFCTRGATA